MPGNVVRRDGRPRENELTDLPAVVYGTPDVVPDRGLDLPLIDEARPVPILRFAPVSDYDLHVSATR